MLVSQEPVRRPVPHEQYPDDPTREGEWIEFLRLPSSVMTEAREKKAKKAQSEAAGMLRELGPKFFQAMKSGDAEERANVARAIDELRYHISNFDVPTLLRKAIVAWSYDSQLPSEYENPADGLDERTAMWAADEIVLITRPPTKEEEGES